MSNESYPYTSQAPVSQQPFAPGTATRVPLTNVFATPAPPRTSEGPSRGRARGVVALVIALFVGECIAAFLWVGTTTYGFTRILSLALAYSVAFRIMFACLAGIIWQLPRFRRAGRTASASGRHKRRTALALPVILLIPSAYISLAHGMPVVVDLMTGPRTVTVSSCTHEMRTHRIKFGDYWSRPTFSRDFTMTLPDGTTRQTVIGLRQFGHAAEIESPLFEACVRHDGETSMTLDVYYRSWVISGARLD
jgi:hypothetical protein